jgi:hypothetical protein
VSGSARWRGGGIWGPGNGVRCERGGELRHDPGPAGTGCGQ